MYFLFNCVNILKRESVNYSLFIQQRLMSGVILTDRQTRSCPPGHRGPANLVSKQGGMAAMPLLFVSL
jgi:hypothetical protein